MIKNMTIGQYFPADSFVHKLDPRTKLIITFILIIFVFLIHSLPGYISMVAFLALTIAFSKISFRLVLKSIRSIWFVIFITFILNIFFLKGEEMLFEWQFIRIYKEGLIKACEMAGRLVILVIISSMLTYTTSAKEITDAIEILFGPLKKIKFPVHEMALMMSIALRFIPTLLEETDRIMKAQTARGASFDTGGLISRIKGMLPILIPLFISAFKRAEDLALAMEARCYHGGDNRTRLVEYHYKFRDLIAFALTALEIVIILIAK